MSHKKAHQTKASTDGGSGPQYCLDPWKTHEKRRKNKLFLIVNDSYFQKFQDVVPNLKDGDVLCSSCKARAYTLLKNMKDEVQLTSALSEEETELKSTSEDDEEFHDLKTEKRSLASKLKYFDIDEKEIMQPYISNAAASSMYNRMKARVGILKTHLQKVSGSKKPLSPLLSTKAHNCDDNCSKCVDLIQSFSVRFGELDNKDDMYKLLTSLPKDTTISTVVEMFQCSTHMARTASHLRNTVGVFQTPAWKTREGISSEIIKCIKLFYASDDVSRVDPCMRRTVFDIDGETGEKKLFAKRLIWMTLVELYSEFQKLHPEIKISQTSFYLLKPKFCVWSGRAGYHNTCTCSIHENFNLMLNALSITADLNSLLTEWFCSADTDTCVFNLCDYCPHYDKIEKLLDAVDLTQIKFQQWGNVDGLYGIQLQTLEMDKDAFKMKFKNAVPIIAGHHFVLRKQRDYIRFLKETHILEGDSAILHVDFSQNYEFTIQNAVAGYHWSNNQATVHPFALTWADDQTHEIKTKAYVVISDELSHTASTFHAFRYFVIERIKQEGLVFKNLHYVSDGAGSQYKNYKNFVNLMFHENDFGIKASHTFTAAAHGKGPCDAAGATLKSACHRASLKPDPKTKSQAYIRTIEEMAKFAQSLNSPTFQVMYVTTDQVEKVLQQFDIEKRYNRAKTISGTRLYHSYEPASNTELKVKRYSTSCISKTINFIDTASTKITKPRKSQFVVVLFNAKKSVGVVLNVIKETDEFEIQLMNRQVKSNTFFWPKTEKISMFAFDEIMFTVGKPKLKSGGKDMFEFNERDTLKIIS